MNLLFDIIIRHSATKKIFLSRIPYSRGFRLSMKFIRLYGNHCHR